MNDGEDSTLIEAHRFSRQAEEAVKKGHWQQAIDRHTRAAQNFRACIGLTSHPAGDKALQLLAAFHSDSADRVRARLQPQSARNFHFVPQPPLLIHPPPANSVASFAEPEQPVELEKFRASQSPSKPTELAVVPTALINIQIQTVNPVMTAKSQAHMNKLESLLSQLSEVCQSDSSNRISKETVQLFVTEMREQLHGLRDNSNSSTAPPALTEQQQANPATTNATAGTNTSAVATAAAAAAEQQRLAAEQQIGTLEKQLAEEKTQRQQLQHKLEKTEAIVAKHKQRWHMLQEAAKKREFGDGKEPHPSR